MEIRSADFPAPSCFFGADMKETASIRSLRGIGEKTERLLGKLGIATVGDLLEYYPREYDMFQPPVEISRVQDQEKAAVSGVVTEPVQVKRVKNLTISSVVIADRTGKCRMTWFHMPYIRNQLVRGKQYVFRGKMIFRGGLRMMEQPVIYQPVAYEKKLNTMQPVYALTAGLTNNAVTKAVFQVLDDEELTEDYLPETIRKRESLADYGSSLRQIHFPKDRESYLEARNRLAFDEFLLFILGLKKLKEKNGKESNQYPINAEEKTEYVRKTLPYRLTEAQKKVWHQLKGDLRGDALMTRLVQGDVGCGKTILAFLAMILMAENGYQSALMVPTEVLARQHFEALTGLLEKNGLLESFRPVLLTGSLSAREKKERYRAIREGETRMVVGTHALIQEPVVYRSLALVITDEQHRFGVRQRELLAEKGACPHVLVMSATPIPRTLGMILYGDLDISVIDQLPAARVPVKNCVVNTGYRPQAYRFIENQVKAGRQAYIICPMVEASEGMEGENVRDYGKKLAGELSPGIRVGILHGRMKPLEKQEVMEEFARNRIQVLVSTTVVEVGVNVPNATVMMVENAERFGLAQLHQLRGRVGRGSFQSYCIFMQGNGREDTSRRLQILKDSNDGFRIAEEDLKLRGPGDLFGIRQSGLLNFGVADIFRDAELMKRAAAAAVVLMEQDAQLRQPENLRLGQKLQQYMNSEEGPGL